MAPPQTYSVRVSTVGCRAVCTSKTSPGDSDKPLHSLELENCCPISLQRHSEFKLINVPFVALHQIRFAVFLELLIIPSELLSSLFLGEENSRGKLQQTQILFGVFNSKRPSLWLVPFATKVFPAFFLTSSPFRKKCHAAQHLLPYFDDCCGGLQELISLPTTMSPCNSDEFSEMVPMVSVLLNRLTWTTRGYPPPRPGEVAERRIGCSCQLCFTFCRVLQDPGGGGQREGGKRFSLRGDKRIGMFENF